MNTPADALTRPPTLPEATEDRARAEALLLGYTLPAGAIDTDLIQRDIAGHLRRTVEDCLHVGRALVVLKAACGHGNFMNRLKVLGLARGVASKFMSAARKFAGVAQPRQLLAAVGNQAKLFELLVLDDEQVEELEHTGRTGALCVEDIAGMSVRRLRAAVRAELDSPTGAPELLSADDGLNELADEHMTRTVAAQVGTTNPAAGLRIAGFDPAAPVIGIEGYALKPGDRVMHASNRPSCGTVQAVYPGGAAEVLWDGWELFGTGAELGVPIARLRRLDTPAGDVQAAAGQAASRLQAGDCIVSRRALRAGKVVKVYPDGSACIVWDDGEPPPEGMGHERVPRALLALAPNWPATLARRKAYGQALAKTLLRYAEEREVDDVVEELELLVRQISERRAAPGLVAARYEIFRKFWLQGGAA